MKLFNIFGLAVAAVLTTVSFASCDDDDDTVKSYKLHISLSSSEVESSLLSGLKVYISGTSNDTLDLDAITAATVTLPQGTYNVAVDGKVSDDVTKRVNGSASNIALYEDQSVDVELATYYKSPLVFKTIYSTGGAQYYVMDSYIEIVNNSDEVQYLDGLILADPLSNLKAQSAWQEAYPDLYCCGQGNVLAFPGNGTDYPLQPGEFIVLADEALNHQLQYEEDESLKEQYAKCPDLSAANWEKYYGNGDIDNEAVHNVKRIFSNNQYMKMWAFGAMGRSYILAKLPEGVDPETFAADENNLKTTPGSTSSTLYLMIPSAYVLDAVELYNPATDPAENYPFFLEKDDVKGIQCSASYTGKCVRRKVSAIENGRVYYQDTNNSSNDWKNEQDNTPAYVPTTVDAE